jgi:hypothetical protein
MHKLIISFLYELVFIYTKILLPGKPIAVPGTPSPFFLVIVSRKTAGAHLLFPTTPNTNNA